MAEVAFAGHHHRHTNSISSFGPVAMATGGAPKIEMMPNPDFSFPMLPQPSNSPRLPSAGTSRRPVSMHSNAPPSLPLPIAHRRAKSNLPLPTFSFNAVDNSGLLDNSTPPMTPDESEPTTPSRRMGHKRGGSEFVGGDSRLGVNGAISSSPTKATAFPLPVPSPGPPAGRRGHRHQRSGAMSISGHDLNDIVQPAEVEPRLSSSLPNTPWEFPAQAPQTDRTISAPDVTGTPSDPFGQALEEDMEARPPSRRVVGFADNVEYIPRPLSTISSETESSMSTVHGHSVNNSISSVLSLGTSSPPSARNPRTSLSTTFEDEVRPRARSSIEISKRIEKEGEWLRRSSSSQEVKRPLSESAMTPPTLTFAVSESSVKPRNVHNKKHSLSHALGLDRRRSEPVISLKAEDQARLSAISLQQETRGQTGTDARAGCALERKSSKKKIRDWAVSKLGKKAKDVQRTSSEPDVASAARPQSAGETSVDGKVPVLAPAGAETDLEAVFSSQMSLNEQPRLTTPPQPRIEVSTPTPSHTSSFQSRDLDDTSVLDLDAALGPLKTPPIGGHKPRRELHSSRLTRDFGGSGLHYHRRAESAPELPPFGFSKGCMASQSSLPDVFETDGDEEADTTHTLRPNRSRAAQAEEVGIGIQVVDADDVSPGSTFSWGTDEGLGIQRDDWEPERPTTSYGTTNSRLSTPSMEPRRASSIVEETIVEELSPVDSEPIDIVEAHEEPRTSSLTKSSDSSETPTLLASQTGTLALPDGAQSLMTPDTYHTSTFSSPDFSRRQGSFDTSRLGTSASSITDNRTMSSCTGEQGHEVRTSVDDVPSLTSSRSTMMSNMHANTSRRDFSDDRTSSLASGTLDPTVAAERRRKRASIQSLSQLVGGSFGSKLKAVDNSRPHTAVESIVEKTPKKKEHRLKKLMFWRSKSKQSLHSTS